MNNSRRKNIEYIIEDLQKLLKYNLKEDTEYIADELENIEFSIESVVGEEQDSLDNIPENLRYSSRCEDMEENINDLNDISSDVSSLAQSIRDNMTQDLNEKIQEIIEALNRVTER